MRFDDGSTMRLYRQTVEDFGLYTGMELSEEQMDKLRTAAGALSAKMRAVRIVSASSVSKQDLEQRLVHKGEDPQQAKAAVAWMAELDLIDDRKTAEQIVNRFGSETLLVLDHESRRLREIPGIGQQKAKRIIGAWRASAARRDIFIFLQGLGITPAFCQKLYLFRV